MGRDTGQGGWLPLVGSTCWHYRGAYGADTIGTIHSETLPKTMAYFGNLEDFVMVHLGEKYGMNERSCTEIERGIELRC